MTVLLNSRLRRATFALAITTIAACGADDPFVSHAGDVTVDAGGGDAAGDSADVGAEVSDEPDMAADVDAGHDAEPDAQDGSEAADVDAQDEPPPPDTSSDPDVLSDPDAPSDPNCGNGRIDGEEECDDGNEIDNDSCTNACVVSFCGDGVINATPSSRTFEAPLVRWYDEATEGYVCDDGASCPAGVAPSRCDVSGDPQASEHGICQMLGLDRATEVLWGGGAGAGQTTTLHALNWECWDYFCLESPFADLTTSCTQREMLAEISCEGVVREECDDGVLNADAADSCRTTCRAPRCGDGITDSGEECDDGDRVTDDGCSNNCLLPQCGDGVVNGLEECDDTNDDNTDGCLDDCTRARCGDGFVASYARDQELSSPVVTGPTGATGHVCDDGGTCQGSSCDVSTNGNAPEHGICQALGFDRALFVRWGGGLGESDSRMPHAYNWTCSGFRCGPGGSTYDGDNCGAGEMLSVLRCFGGYTETCDLGAENADVAGAACRTDCTLPRCGDGVVDPDRGEACDDGNTTNDDACSNACGLPVCGDGVRQGAEQCDDANTIETDSCRGDCRTHVCGDGFLADAEQCDDGAANSEAPDASCRTNCRLSRCGDGVADSGEECDDGNTTDNDGCANACTLPICGDGIRQTTEPCDDGNTVETDACRGDCTLHVCGDGFLADAEECDDGAANSEAPDASCRLNCRAARCGDGVVDSGEPCDDGNTNDRDLCLVGCVAARCGDGIRQPARGEDCDDGNLDDTDSCQNDCTGVVEGFEACADEDLGSATGDRLRAGTTAGLPSRYTAGCAASARGGDIAYNWIAPETRAYDINMVGSAYDTALHIRAMPDTFVSDPCAESVELLCNDDAVGVASRVTLAATASAAYLIIVDGFSTGSGEFVLNINPI